jgi:pimeloyl-ACP methyl ester carboxylesterase
MAYMDVEAKSPNGKTVVLLHGKNFNGIYWESVISALSEKGYRVIIPDQVGWGMSDKPNIHYSYHLLAQNTHQLLDSLKVKRIYLVGHSMGGMLAMRFSLMYPETVEKMVLENPIGLEDYKTFVPYHTTDQQYESELKATYESMKKYQQGYYPEWKIEYEKYVQAQFQAMQYPDFKTATWASALTYQMIYEQPVIYEAGNIKTRTLIIIGQEDRTIVGKNLLTPDIISGHGKYPQLGKDLQKKIRNSELFPVKGAGHIPHIQTPEIFLNKIKSFFDSSVVTP